MNYVFINNAKAILILLVVTWHFHYTAGALPGKDFVYSFHVPAFMIISGFLFGPGVRSLKVDLFTIKYLSPMLRGYIFFSFLSCMIFIVSQLLKDQGLASIDLGALLVSVLYGVGAGDYAFNHRNLPLWYFTFFVTSMMVFLSVMKFNFLLVLILLLGIQTIIEHYFSSKWFWNIDVSVIGALLVFTGVVFREYFDKYSDRIRSISPVFFVVSGILVFLMLLVSNFVVGSINYNGGELGEVAALSYVVSVLGFVLVSLVSLIIPRNKFFDLVGRNTLVIFSLHFPIVIILSVVVDKFGLNFGIVKAIFFSVVICAGLSYFASIFRRPLTYIIGK